MKKFEIEVDFSEQIVAKDKFGGKKRSELAPDQYLFPETKSYPIVDPVDVKNAIRDYGRGNHGLTYEAFLRKLYNKIKNRPELLKALPKESRDKLGLKD